MAIDLKHSFFQVIPHIDFAEPSNHFFQFITILTIPTKMSFTLPQSLSTPLVLLELKFLVQKPSMRQTHQCGSV